MVLSNGFSYRSHPFCGSQIPYGHQASQFRCECQQRPDFNRLGAKRSMAVLSRTESGRILGRQNCRDYLIELHGLTLVSAKACL